MPDDAFRYRRGARAIAMGERAAPAEVAPLLRLLGQRVTSRTFVTDPIPFGALATILSATFRYRDHDDEAFRKRGLATPTRRRSSPSGGSLQSCEAYVLVQRVEDLRPGVYHYWSDADSLGFMHETPRDLELGHVLFEQAFAKDAGALIVMTGRFDKTWWKYRTSRAYRVVMMDCGHLSQTAQLVATSFGLQTWPTGAFYDDLLADLLALPRQGPEFPLLVVALGGKGAPNPFDPAQGAPT
jgi:SagB-type dehydrogenase family enzyme